jgi:hypothetical protein
VDPKGLEAANGPPSFVGDFVDDIGIESASAKIPTDPRLGGPDVIFKWIFATDAKNTPPRPGYIIQHVKMTVTIHYCGTDVEDVATERQILTDNDPTALHHLTNDGHSLEYWEYWRVTDNGIFVDTKPPQGGRVMKPSTVDHFGFTTRVKEGTFGTFEEEGRAAFVHEDPGFLNADDKVPAAGVNPSNYAVPQGWSDAGTTTHSLTYWWNYPPAGRGLPTSNGEVYPEKGKLSVPTRVYR